MSTRITAQKWRLSSLTRAKVLHALRGTCHDGKPCSYKSFALGQKPGFDRLAGGSDEAPGSRQTVNQCFRVRQVPHRASDKSCVSKCPRAEPQRTCPLWCVATSRE